MEQFASLHANYSWLGKLSYFLGGPFCAPIFIAVMGYFLASSEKTLLCFIKRGVLLFSAGILLNIGRSFHLFITIFQGKYNLDPLFFVFGADILSLAGLSIIILAFLRLISKKSLFLFIPIIILFASLDNFINTENQPIFFFFAYIIGDFDYSYFPLFPWFSYVLSGYVFKIIYDKFNHILSPFTYIHWTFVALLTSVIIFFTPYAFNISMDLNIYYHHHFEFFLWVTGFMLLYVLLMNAITKEFGNSLSIKYISWVGKNVTLIYVVQWLIIGNIATAIYQTQNFLECELWFIGITLFSCFVTIIYQKIMDYNKERNESLI